MKLRKDVMIIRGNKEYVLHAGDTVPQHLIDYIPQSYFARRYSDKMVRSQNGV